MGWLGGGGGSAIPDGERKEIDEKLALFRAAESSSSNLSEQISLLVAVRTYANSDVFRHHRELLGQKKPSPYSDKIAELNSVSVSLNDKIIKQIQSAFDIFTRLLAVLHADHRKSGFNEQIFHLARTSAEALEITASEKKQVAIQTIMNLERLERNNYLVFGALYYVALAMNRTVEEHLRSLGEANYPDSRLDSLRKAVSMANAEISSDGGFLSHEFREHSPRQPSIIVAADLRSFLGAFGLKPFTF